MISVKTILSVGAVAVAVSFGCQTGNSAEPATQSRQLVVASPSGADPITQPDSRPQTKGAPQGKQGKAKTSKGSAKADPIDGHEFPPTIPDTPSHKDTWLANDCLRCHETGVQAAPVIKHRGLPHILLTAKCRTCHVFVPGSKPRIIKAKRGRFENNAFPPMIPASASHPTVWWKDDCLMCHEDGLRGAPKVVHKGMPRILLTAKCRTCHVQVRASAAEQQSRRGH